MLNIISLGAGVQSSTMALMAAHGEITPMPDCAIFADTGAEPQGVYDWLDWLEKQLPFPVHRVMHKEGLRANIVGAIAGGRFAGAPFFTESNNKAGGMLRRQCTREFKVEPIIQKTRRLLGIGKGERAAKQILCDQWIGISTDEAQRMKPAREHYISHRYPLIDMNMSRTDCLSWMEKKGYPKPTKSACTFCPYHDDALWRDMKENDAASFADAVAIDEMIRAGVRGTTQKLYVHRSLQPLSQVVFKIQPVDTTIDMFNNECEGMCGV